MKGRGITADPTKARGIHEKACASGSAIACGNLGVLCSTGSGGPKDVEQSIALWTRACEGSGAHCAILAEAYAAGEIVAADASRSAELYRDAQRILTAQCNQDVIACQNNDATGCLRVGESLERESPKRAPEEVLGAHARACSHGSGEGCFRQARLLAKRTDPGSKSDALRAHDRGCVQGEVRACVAGGKLADEKWKGHEPEEDRSTRLRQGACRLGDRASCRW